jgi:two-component system, LytTR family, response regulator
VSIRCVIVDDEPLARQRIRDLLSETSDFEVAGEAEDGAEAIGAIEKLRPDVVFLDIQMPGVDGFEVVEALEPPAPLFVFTTAFDSYAVRAFEAHALDYVLKPVDASRFHDSLSRVRQALDGGSDWQTRMAAFLERIDNREHQLRRVVIREGDRVFFLDVREIDWFEAAGNYIRVHAASATHLIRMTMQTLEKKLDRKQFTRIHRSAIVNVARVSELQSRLRGDYDLVLKNGERLHLQKAYRDRLRTALGDF